MNVQPGMKAYRMLIAGLSLSSANLERNEDNVYGEEKNTDY